MNNIKDLIKQIVTQVASEYGKIAYGTTTSVSKNKPSTETVDWPQKQSSAQPQTPQSSPTNSAVMPQVASSVQTPPPQQVRQQAAASILPGDNQKDWHPYKDLIYQTFPDDAERMDKVAFGESSYNPRKVHFNDFQPGQPSSMVIPKDFTRQQWATLRQQHPNMDVGLFQINTDPSGAMANYLENKGLTFYDLLDPEKNAQIAKDLKDGNIPKKSAGIRNWVAAQDMGMK